MQQPDITICTGWSVESRLNVVEIVPRGEESMHITSAACECRPTLSQDNIGRLVICHNSWDGREAFEDAADNLPHSYQGRRAA